MTVARMVRAGILTVAATLVLIAWGIGLVSGDATPLGGQAGTVLFLLGLPLIVIWLVPGSAAVRLGVILVVLAAVDAATVDMLALGEKTYLLDAWPWLAVPVGGGLLYGLTPSRAEPTNVPPEQAAPCAQRHSP